jgi:hypothetical protein
MENTSDDPLVRKAGNTDEEESERLLQLSGSLSYESHRLFNELEHRDRLASRIASLSVTAESRREYQAKIAKLKEDSKEAFRLHQGLQLQVVCQKLRQNDPTIQKIDRYVISHLLEGYGHQLGCALKGNTNVRFLFCGIEPFGTARKSESCARRSCKVCSANA